MTLKVGIDFGTSNSGVAVSQGGKVRLLPIDPGNVIPEVVKTILYVTRDYQHYIGQEAIELYYKHNINRIRRYEKQWTGAIRVLASEVDYMHDVFVDVDVLKPGRLLQYLKTALRRGMGAADIAGTQMFERYYTVTDLIQAYLSALKARAETLLGEEIGGVTLGRPVKFSEDPQKDRQSQDRESQTDHVQKSQDQLPNTPAGEVFPSLQVVDMEQERRKEEGDEHQEELPTGIPCKLGPDVHDEPDDAQKEHDPVDDVERAGLLLPLFLEPEEEEPGETHGAEGKQCQRSHHENDQDHHHRPDPKELRTSCSHRTSRLFGAAARRIPALRTFIVSWLRSPA